MDSTGGLETDGGPNEDIQEPKNSKARSLEMKYIELLEKRIAQLEASLQRGNDKDEDRDASKTDGDEEKDTKQEKSNNVESGNDGQKKTPLIHFVVSKFDHATSQRRDFDTPPEPSQETKIKHPVVFRRYMNSENEKKFDFEELNVAFDGLRELLREILEHTAAPEFEADVISFRSPFRNFVWQWDKLMQACEPLDTDSEKRRLAREYLKEAMALIKASEALSSYFKSYPSTHAGDSITFDYLWTIFPPGTKVVSKLFLDEVQMFEVQSCIRSPSRSGDVYLITIAGFDWDGYNFRQMNYRIYVPLFQGSMPIKSLRCFPVSHYRAEDDPEGEKLRADLISRGLKFVDLCTSKVVHHRYEGQFLYHTGNDNEDSDDEQVNNPAVKNGQLRRSEVITDNATFMRSRRNPANGSLPLGSSIASDIDIFQCPCISCGNSLSREWTRKLSKFETKQHQYNAFKNSVEHLLLCPPRVLGYSLKLGRWAQFSVKRVQHIVVADTESFEAHFDKNLQVDAACKKLLKALVQTHHSNADKADKADVVEGKGKGLVILLHGPPGVGKTLTAETVALATRKPLMLVSTAEIGLEPDVAERNLTDIFEDAGRWQAVLLMDEADIFLEERRGTRDLHRNALVAVLLRVLEYYEGIIIMTTNRIASLDVAVESRIHLAIRYPDLGIKEKVAIFENFLEDVIGEENIEDSDRLLGKIEKMVRRSRINGRQIRNILTSAHLLAKSKRRKLKFEDVEEVNEITEQFLDGLKELTQKKRLANEGSINS